MKLRMFTLMLLAVLLMGLLGCSMESAGQKLDAVEDAVENRMDQAEDALENAVQTSNFSNQAAITPEQAQAIALEHAGFTADQVKYLRTEYEIDDGVPQYEVQFHQDRWEYDYEINADTGAIMSYDMDD